MPRPWLDFSMHCGTPQTLEDESLSWSRKHNPAALLPLHEQNLMADLLPAFRVDAETAVKCIAIHTHRRCPYRMAFDGGCARNAFCRNDTGSEASSRDVARYLAEALLKTLREYISSASGSS